MIRIILLPLLTLAIGFFSVIGSGKVPAGPDPYAYPEPLPGSYTGGFGEETCRSCHFDFPLNYEKAKLRVDGFPKQFETGRSYPIRIAIERSDLGMGGFQIASRFQDGRQAGRFRLLSDRTQYTFADSASIQYVQHSPEGTKPGVTGLISWQLEWIAPNTAQELVVHISGNAANGDASEFGDYILRERLSIAPAD